MPAGSDGAFTSFGFRSTGSDAFRPSAPSSFMGRDGSEGFLGAMRMGSGRSVFTSFGVIFIGGSRFAAAFLARFSSIFLTRSARITSSAATITRRISRSREKERRLASSMHLLTRNFSVHAACTSFMARSTRLNSLSAASFTFSAVAGESMAPFAFQRS